MIKHIVMFKLLDSAEGASKNENAVRIKQLLDKLPFVIPEIHSYEVGINIIDTERASDIAIISAFNSLEELEIYLKHPEHLKAVEYISKRRSEIISVDYEVN